MQVQANKYFKCIVLIFVCCFLFYGMYYEFCGAIMSVALSVILCAYLIRRRELALQLNMGIIFSLLLVVAYTVTSIYAIDSGMAVLGIFRYTWILLFAFCYMQLEQKKKDRIMGCIPYVGVSICILGVVAVFITELHTHLFVNERLGGCFQYPNTFALFLLVGVIILGNKKRLQQHEYVCLLCLFAGILMTGSRIVLVMGVCAWLYLSIKNRNRKLFVCVGIVVLAGLLYFLFTKDTSNIGRLATFSLTDSALIGRILYAKDALTLLIEHPFGLGSMGYYYMQSQIQTGVYAVLYVHNDWLQIGLDVGWFPMLFYAFSVVKAFCSKCLCSTQKLILATIVLHGLLDFDFSYGVMLCIVLLIMTDVPLGKEKKYKHIEFSGWKQRITVGVIAVWSMLCVYISVPLIAYYNGNAEMAVNLYPWYTEAKLQLLSESENIDRVELLADEVLEQNDTCALAYYAKAMVAYCKDDYENVIHYQKEAIKRDYFSGEVYVNYAYTLYDGALYIEDEQISQMCKAEVYRIPQYLEEAKMRLSKLGSMIDDQPELEISEEIEWIIEEISIREIK